MKQLMIIGGLAGFLIGLGFGSLQQSPWPNILWRSLVVTYAAALLMRWWGGLWIRGLRESQHAFAAARDVQADAVPSRHPNPAPAK